MVKKINSQVIIVLATSAILVAFGQVLVQGDEPRVVFPHGPVSIPMGIR